MGNLKKFAKSGIGLSQSFNFVYTLDTNAIIYYAQGDSEAVKLLEKISAEYVPIYISSITITELFSTSISASEMLATEEAIRSFSITSIDSLLARNAGFLRRDHKLRLGDSIIAATALFTGSTLVTRNIKDFKKVPNLKVLKI